MEAWSTTVGGTYDKHLANYAQKEGVRYSRPSKVCCNGGSTLAGAGDSCFSSVEKQPVACATRARVTHTHAHARDL